MIKLIIFESYSFYMTDFDILLYFVGKGLFYYLKTIMASNQRRQWQPTQVLLPGKSHGRRSLIGYSPWGYKELDMTE